MSGCVTNQMGQSLNGPWKWTHGEVLWLRLHVYIFPIKRQVSDPNLGILGWKLLEEGPMCDTELGTDVM